MSFSDSVCKPYLDSSCPRAFMSEYAQLYFSREKTSPARVAASNTVLRCGLCSSHDEL